LIYHASGTVDSFVILDYPTGESISFGALATDIGFFFYFEN